MEAVRALESTPVSASARIKCHRLEPGASKGGRLPVADACADAVTFGLGAHEFSVEERAQLCAEARRVLKPGGKFVVFEHAEHPLNFVIFGPTIFHWEKRSAWRSMLVEQLGAKPEDVKHHLWSFTVDAFIAKT